MKIANEELCYVLNIGYKITKTYIYFTDNLFSKRITISSSISINVQINRIFLGIFFNKLSPWMLTQDSIESQICFVFYHKNHSSSCIIIFPNREKWNTKTNVFSKKIINSCNRLVFISFKPPSRIGDPIWAGGGLLSFFITLDNYISLKLIKSKSYSCCQL